MSVAQHLKIKLSEYDRRIRTFIPNYEKLLSEVAATAALVEKKQPTIVDLGIGTGALSARCLAISPQARLVGIDADPDILALAQRRLAQKRAQKPTLIQGNFVENSLPRCDVIVASLALHHIAEEKTKQRFYAKCFTALRRGGIFANGDCFMPENSKLSQHYMKIWEKHLRQFYSLHQMQGFFAAWAEEDTYFPLVQELAMLKAVGFEVEVTWRQPPFAVVMGKKP
jgi:ubiquinone/menaquinone biosynthesis C-methylase UbiE